MLEAVSAGDAAEVERLLEADPALASARGADGVSAILQARYHGHAWMAERLADSVAELSLFEAAALGRAGRVDEMVRADPETVRSTAADGFTALHLAAFFGQLEATAVLLEHGAAPDVVAANPSRVQPLHSAAAGGHAAIVGLLLERGADPNARQHGGSLPSTPRRPSGIWCRCACYWSMAPTALCAPRTGAWPPTSPQTTVSPSSSARNDLTVAFERKPALQRCGRPAAPVNLAPGRDGKLDVRVRAR